MLKHLAVLVCIAAAACGSAPDEAAPVATPSLTLSPPALAIGTPVDMTYTFAVADNAPPFPDDLLVFVHFVSENGEQMWTDDHRPPVPRDRWKPGATVTYTRTMFVPRYPSTGPAHVVIGLYSQRTGERLPLAAESEGQRAYRVASTDLRLQTQTVLVTFRDGWYEPEGSDDGSVEWHWSQKAGTLAFRNPKRDARLLLDVDQPVGGLPSPQRVEVRVGTAVLDTFMLTPGARELRRLELPAAQAGTADTVEVVVAVEPTFVPSSLPALRSNDPRELGIRVFHAYVEPK